MSKTLKGIVVVVSVLAIAGGVYYITQNKKIRYARGISKYTGTGYMKYLTMDEGYLAAWAKALRRKDADFTYNNEAYSSETGKKNV